MNSYFDENYYLEKEGLSGKKNYLVEMDELAILKKDGTCYVYTITKDKIDFKEVIEDTENLFTPAVGTCLAIYGDLGKESEIKLLLHLTPRESLTNTITQINLLLKNLLKLPKDSTQFYYIFGGTKESIAASKEKDGANWDFPKNTFGDSGSRIENEGEPDENTDDEFLHLFITKNGIKIYQFSPNDAELKTYFQATNFEDEVVLLEAVKVDLQPTSQFIDTESALKTNSFFSSSAKRKLEEISKDEDSMEKEKIEKLTKQEKKK